MARGSVGGSVARLWEVDTSRVISDTRLSMRLLLPLLLYVSHGRSLPAGLTSTSGPKRCYFEAGENSSKVPYGCPTSVISMKPYPWLLHGCRYMQRTNNHDKR